MVRVTRTGGIAGLQREREVDLDEDSELARGLRSLAGSGRLSATRVDPRPDRFVYRISGDDLDLTLLEQDLPDAERSLLERALRS